MSSKQSKSERKDDKIQMLERELSETKKKLKTQSKTVILEIKNNLMISLNN